MKTLLTATAILLLGITTSSHANIVDRVLNSVSGSTCGVSGDVVRSLKSKQRGPVDGGFDENGDGRVDHIEAFTMWDYAQTLTTINAGVEHQPYKWTNIDTCYVFHLTPLDFFEDKSQPILWQTCRKFVFAVIDPKGEVVGGSNNEVACRNFGTREWMIL